MEGQFGATGETQEAVKDADCISVHIHSSSFRKPVRDEGLCCCPAFNKKRELNKSLIRDIVSWVCGLHSASEKRGYRSD